MSIRLAIVPNDVGAIETLLPAIKEAGFAGLELSAEDAGKLRPALDAAGLKVACVLTNVNLQERDPRKWEAAAGELGRAMEVAREAKATCVRIFPGDRAKGEGLGAAVSRLAARLGELLKLATDSDMSIAMQNSGGFVDANSLWQLLEIVAHPLLGVSLDLAAGSLSGESPLLSIPTLNAKILHVRVWDYKDGKVAPLGEGVSKIKIGLERLRGIGYQGYVSLAPPTGVDVKDVAALKAIGHTLGLWTGIIEPPKPVEPAKPAPAAKPAAAKPAAASTASAPASTPSGPATTAEGPKPPEKVPANP